MTILLSLPVIAASLPVIPSYARNLLLTGNQKIPARRQAGFATLRMT